MTASVYTPPPEEYGKLRGRYLLEVDQRASFNNTFVVPFRGRRLGGRRHQASGKAQVCPSVSIGWLQITQFMQIGHPASMISRVRFATARAEPTGIRTRSTSAGSVSSSSRKPSLSTSTSPRG